MIKQSSWVTCWNVRPQAQVRLFCFPYAGGGASAFYTWSSNLPPEIELCSIQLPGRESRLMEPAFTQLAPLLETLVPTLQPYLDLPFAFYGHSMGALVGFELARYLRKQNHAVPLHLFVSSCVAPQRWHSSSPIYNLPEPALLEELRRFNGTPKEILQHPELMSVLLPTIRADFTVVETYTYTPEEPLTCPISAFGGLDDRGVRPEDLEAWREQTTATFTLRMFLGDHFFLHNTKEPLLQAIWRDLAYFLR